MKHTIVGPCRVAAEDTAEGEVDQLYRLDKASRTHEHFSKNASGPQFNAQSACRRL